MSTPDGTLQRSIGRMEGKMDALLVSVNQIGTTLVDHDLRIRKLEETRAEIAGKFKAAHAVWAFLAGGAGAALTKLTGLHV